MTDIEITSLSSRGQIVIPQGLRDKMHLHEGEKFAVIGEDDTIVLRKLETPSFKDVEKLLKKTREFGKNVKSEDVQEAINRVRNK